MRGGGDTAYYTPLVMLISEFLMLDSRKSHISNRFGSPATGELSVIEHVFCIVNDIAADLFFDICFFWARVKLAR